VDKSEIESLSNLVFGLAISIGGIALIIVQIPTTPADLIKEVLWFSVGFVLLIVIWFNYTRAMAEIIIETPLEFILNIVILLLVSLEPFLLNVLAFDIPDTPSAQSTVEIASVMFAAVIAAIMLILAVYYHWIMVDKKDQNKLEKALENRHRRDLRLVDASIFLVSTLPIFWRLTVDSLPVRYLLWGTTLIPAAIVYVHNHRHHRGHD
jgi:uncharacterized membrane protein